MLFCLLSPCHLLSPLLFFFKLPATTEIYTLSLHDALPIYPFVAEIRIFTFNFAPKGWAWCDGQLLPLSQNTALFSLLGTTYGGDGKSNFALPNLQGSAGLHVGGNQPGPGLSLYDLGQTGGTDNVTLLLSEMPSHNHFMTAQTIDQGD